MSRLPAEEGKIKEIVTRKETNAKREQETESEKKQERRANKEEQTRKSNQRRGRGEKLVMENKKAPSESGQN